MRMRNLFLLFVVLCLLGGLASSAFAAPVKMEFFFSQGLYYSVFKGLIDQFNKANPDIIIEPNTSPEPEKVLQTRVMSNTVPDLISLWSSSADFKAYAKDDVWLDLTGQPVLKKVNQDFLKSLRIGGKDYSLPYAYTGVGLYYNKKIFSDNGLTPPKTYDDLINIAKKLKAKGITAFAFADKDDWTHGKLNMPLYVVTIPNWQKFFSDLEQGKVSAKSNPDYRKFAQRVLELREYGQSDSLASDYTASIAMFANGKSAMLIEGTWALGGLLEANPKLDTELLPFPGNTVDTYNFPITIDTSFAVSSRVKDKKAALKVLDFLASAKAAQEYTTALGCPMLIQGIAANVSQFKPIMAAYAKGKAAPWPQDLWPAEVYPENYKVVQNLVLTKNIDQFIEQTDKMFADARQ